MKKVNYLYLFLALQIFCNIVIAQNGQHDKGVTDQISNHLEQMIKAKYGVNYILNDLVNPDSLYPGKFPLLKGKLVFGVGRGTPPFIGVADKDHIIWTSKKEISNGENLSIDRIQDINDDGKPEILALNGGGFSSTAYDLWIYSWDGKVGKRINPVNNGYSAIGFFDTPEAYGFVDTNSDRILRIRILTLENKILYFYWDGSQYCLGTPNSKIKKAKK
jgi:hypothetical protein